MLEAYKVNRNLAMSTLVGAVTVPDTVDQEFPGVMLAIGETPIRTVPVVFIHSTASERLADTLLLTLIVTE